MNPPAHNPNADVTLSLLARYLSGECTYAERERVEEWLAAVPGRRAQLEELRKLWFRASNTSEVSDTSALAAKIIAHAAAQTTSNPAPVAERRRPSLRALNGANHGGRRRWPWLAAAALVIAVPLYQLTRYEPPPPAAKPAAPPSREFTTGRGERARLTLADGTEVLLGPDSRLRVPASMTDSMRELALEGSATFKVTHDPARLFIVRTPQAVIRDVGTVFGVKAYAETRTSEVGVIEGVVAVRSVVGDSSTLNRRDLARVTDRKLVTRHNVDLTTFFESIEQKRLVFEGTPVPEAVAQIERELDLEIKLVDSELSDRRIHATFTEQSTKEIIEQLALLLGCEFERSGRDVVLRVKATAPSRQ
jgi:transmembrane sensor